MKQRLRERERDREDGVEIKRKENEKELQEDNKCKKKGGRKEIKRLKIGRVQREREVIQKNDKYQRFLLDHQFTN